MTVNPLWTFLRKTLNRARDVGVLCLESLVQVSDEEALV